MIKTFEDAKKRLERITLNNPPFPISLSILEGAEGDLTLMVETSVLDRDTGKDLIIEFKFGFYLPLEDDDFDCWVNSRVRAVFIHEFEECFFVDGKRYRDPHPFARAKELGDDNPMLDFSEPTNVDRLHGGSVRKIQLA